MTISWQLAILALTTAVSGEIVPPLCPPKCTCKPREIECVTQKLTEPPVGVWDDVQSLDLTNNKITVLYSFSFTGFRGLHSLFLSSNYLPKLDFANYAALPNLTYLCLWGNGLTRVQKPPDGLRLAALEKLDLSNNKITSLDPDFLAAAVPNLKYFFFTDNPVFVLQHGPVLNQPMLQHASFERTNMSAVSALTFQRVPALQILLLADSGVENVSGAFVSNPHLLFLELRGCAVTAVAAGTCASGGKLGYLSLEQNPLTQLDLHALDCSLKSGGLLEISDTPLACACGHQRIHDWAKQEGVEVSATCKWRKECSFAD